VGAEKKKQGKNSNQKRTGESFAETFPRFRKRCYRKDEDGGGSKSGRKTKPCALHPEGFRVCVRPVSWSAGQGMLSG